MKRKITAIFFALVLLSTVCSVCLADDTCFNMFAQSDKTEVSKGDTFSVSFYTNDISDPAGILSLEAYIEYDPESIKLLDIKEIIPASWENSCFFQYNERTSGKKRRIQLTMLWDGNEDPTDLVIRNDNEFGVKLDFSVETLTKSATTIDILSDSLVATTFLPDIKSVAGKGTSCAIKLNGFDGDIPDNSSDDASGDNNSSNDASSAESGDEPSESEDSSAFVSDDSAEQGSQTESEDISDSSSSATSGESESASKTDDSAEGSQGGTLSDSSENESGASTEESSKPEEKGLGSNIIFWLVIACVIIAAGAVIIYIKKYKKDDMNPVNPG
jgi:hypothetical protein